MACNALQTTNRADGENRWAGTEGSAVNCGKADLIDSCKLKTSTTSHAHRWLSCAPTEVAQSRSQPACAVIIEVRSTTTGIVLLDRRAWHCSERAEHTAVALIRPQDHSTARALVEKLARCDWHCLGRPMSALRTGQDAF